MHCGKTSPRQPFQDLLAELNPGAADYVRRLVSAGPNAEAARQRSLRVGASSEEERRVSKSPSNCLHSLYAFIQSAQSNVEGKVHKLTSRQINMRSW